MGHEIMNQVYMITYPSGKIYIGKDSYGNPRYFGSPDPDIINNDFAILPKPPKPKPLNG